MVWDPRFRLWRLGPRVHVVAGGFGGSGFRVSGVQRLPMTQDLGTTAPGVNNLPSPKTLRDLFQDPPFGVLLEALKNTTTQTA